MDFLPRKDVVPDGTGLRTGGKIVDLDDGFRVWSLEETSERKTSYLVTG